MVVPLAAWRRQLVPIATITKGKSEAYVVVLDGGEVVIRPWMRAPSRAVSG